MDSLRGESVPILLECYQNLPNTWLQLKGGIIIETKTHAAALHGQDEHFIDEAIGKSKPGQHINIWKMDNVWTESVPSPKATKKSKYRIFQARLSTQSLQTPRNIQVLNERKYPLLYPGSECPLCKQGVANDHHILAKCCHVNIARKKSLDKIHVGAQDSLRKIIPGLSIPRLSLIHI